MTFKTGPPRITSQRYLPFMTDFHNLADLLRSGWKHNEEWLFILFRSIGRPVGSRMVLKVGLFGGDVLLSQDLHKVYPSSL